jgi:hypothetical protein
LVVTEPSVIIPGNSRDSVHKQFSTVLELGRPKGSNTIPYPLEWNMDFFSASQRVERVVSITANKYSFIPGELYSLRRLCYKSLRILDLYGQRWNTGSLNLLALICKEAAYALVRNQNICLKDADKLFLMPKNYCGPIDNKFEILSRYKVSLVVENSIEYMSEKLMHSLLAGTIPVYVGPNPKEFGIPGDIVFHAKPTLSDIEKKISEAMDARSDWWNEAALEFLSKREVKKAWSGQAANRRIIDEALRLSN